MVWYISKISISISLLWARCRRLCVHGVTFYPIEGVQFREVLERLCGTDIFYVDRVRGFLSVRCVIVEYSGSLSGLCVPVEIDTVEVSRQGDDPCWCGVWREFCCTGSACREISGCVLRSCEHVRVVVV